MAAFVQIKSGSGSGTSFNLTFDSNVTAGNTIVVGIAKLNAPLGTFTLSGNHSEAFSLVRHHADTGSRQAYQYESTSAPGGATTITLAFSGGAETIAWAVIELDAGAASGSVGAQSGSSTTHAASDLSNTLADAVFVLVSCMNVAPADATAGDGYTQRADVSALYVQTKDVSGVETNDASFTTAAVRRFAHVLAVYESPTEIRGSAVFGEKGTVKASRSILASLDGNTNVLTDAGKMKVVGAFEVATGPVTLPNDSISYAEMQNVSAASRLLGRGSASGSGDVEELTVGTGLQISGTVVSSTVADREWSVLTNGDATTPELIFADGDVIMTSTP